MDGSATFTIVVSSTIIRSPRHSTSSASQRRRSAVAVAVSEVVLWVSEKSSYQVRLAGRCDSSAPPRETATRTAGSAPGFSRALTGSPASHRISPARKLARTPRGEARSSEPERIVTMQSAPVRRHVGEVLARCEYDLAHAEARRHRPAQERTGRARGHASCRPLHAAQLIGWTGSAGLFPEGRFPHPRFGLARAGTGIDNHFVGQPPAGHESVVRLRSPAGDSPGYSGLAGVLERQAEEREHPSRVEEERHLLDLAVARLVAPAAPTARSRCRPRGPACTGRSRRRRWPPHRHDLRPARSALARARTTTRRCRRARAATGRTGAWTAARPRAAARSARPCRSARTQPRSARADPAALAPTLPGPDARRRQRRPRPLQRAVDRGDASSRAARPPRTPSSAGRRTGSAPPAAAAAGAAARPRTRAAPVSRASAARPGRRRRRAARRAAARPT